MIAAFLQVEVDGSREGTVLVLFNAIVLGEYPWLSSNHLETQLIT
jgi:hypothetical protein